MAIDDSRNHQKFPTLTPAQMDAARRFASGPPVRFAPGETIHDISLRDAPMGLVLDGTIEMVRRDGLNGEATITSHGAGQYRHRRGFPAARRPA
ncbi:hypothetical protein [Frigidibacter sp.]|uniref:hypothetical protein n=1 Tax=Frigidibacter sp. TaxID=2586418 RepID=UPI00273666FB|nr:hypothetical protein [Frigidibacter sp.]MDP3340824.1 hypothetical protein [Frigidibacter sp.]